MATNGIAAHTDLRELCTRHRAPRLEAAIGSARVSISRGRLT